ncbi:MAG: pilus assembly protein [Pseudomonadota bacterium]|nr:pilus assembly protein [Pseudomonadota bacterium]
MNKRRLPLFRCYAAIRQCQRGISAIEFALVAPVFLMLMMGIIDFSMIMFTSAVLESATNNTARLGKTGYVASGTTRQQEIINDVATRTAGLLDSSKLSIATEVYSNYNDIGQPEPCISPPTAPCPGTPGVNFTDINGNGTWDADMGAAGLGNAGDVVVYTVSYPWKIMTPIVSAIIGSTFTVTARAVVRNEPYN